MFILFFLLLMIQVCKADVYVLTNSDNSVIGLSEQNDMVIPKGDSITIIKGNISGLPISGDVTLYNFNNGAFTLNKDKVQAKAQSESKAIADQKSKDDSKVSAIGKLKALGLSDSEIKAIIQ